VTDSASREPPIAEPSLPDKLIAVHKRLAASNIPHAFGGDLALAYYAEPSPTVHTDLNVFTSVERWQEAIDALAPLGIKVGNFDPAVLKGNGQLRLWWGHASFNLFFAVDAIHEEMPKLTRRVPFGSTTLPILAPEHLAICKAMFDRPKDWLDIEQMLVATDGMDIAAIEEWLERMVGEEDPRLQRLAELKAELSIPE
jgi:hypothetical protein